MAETDLRLSVDLDVKQAEDTAKDLQEEVRKIFESRNGEQSAAMTNLELQLKKTYDSAEHLRSQLQQLRRDAELTPIKSPAFEEIDKQLDELNARYEELSRTRDEYLSQGYDVPRKEREELTQLEARIEHIEATRDKMMKSGIAFVPVEETEEFQKIENQLDLVNDKFKQQIIRHDEMTQREIENYEKIGQAADRAAEREELRQQKAEQAQVRQGYSTTRRSLSGLRMAVVGVQRLIPGMSSKATSAVFSVTRGIMTLSQVVQDFKGVALNAIRRIGAALLANPLLGPAILAAVAAIAVLIKEMVKLKKAFDMFKAGLQKLGQLMLSLLKSTPRLFKNLMQLTLRLATSVERVFIKGITTAIQKLISLKSVIKENFDMMAQWRDGNNDLNKSLSNLTSSLAYLKASFASAFAPIVTTIEPILTSLTDKLAEVSTNVGIFIAQITGQSKFQKAIRYQKDYAKSIAGTNEQLASFDKLNIIPDGSSNDPEKIGVEFEEIDVEPLNLHIIEELFDKAQAMAKKFTDAVNTIPWKTIKQGASDAALGISNFINGFGEFSGLGSSVGTALGEVFNTVQTFFDGLFENIRFEALGKQIGEFFGNALDTIKWEDVAKTMWAGVRSALATLRGFLSTNPGTKMGKAFSKFLSGALDKNNIPWEDIKASLNGVATNIADFLNATITVENFSKIGTTLGTVMNTLVTTAKTFADEVDWEQWGTALGTAINDFVETFDWELGAKAINQWASDIGLSLRKAIKTIDWELIGDRLVEFISNIDWKKIGEYAVDISRSLRDGLQDVWNKLRDTDAFEEIMNIMRDFFNEYQQWKKMLLQIQWDFIRSWILEAMIGSNFFDNLGADLGQKIREGLTNWITGGGKVTMNEVLGKTSNDSPIKTYTSSYQKGNTTAEKTLTETKETNSTLSDIESLLNERLNPNLKRLNMPLLNNYQVPKLASGTVVPPNASRFLAMLGDNNKETEVVSPLSTIEQALRNVMAEQNVNVTFKVEGDPNGLFKVVQKESVRYNQKTGESAFA